MHERWPEAPSSLSARFSIVYTTIVAASYAIVSRFVAHSGYKLAISMVLGTRRSTILALLLTYTAIVALVGSLLGIAIGTAGPKRSRLPSGGFGWASTWRPS